jgi:hypothetical protein
MTLAATHNAVYNDRLSFGNVDHCSLSSQHPHRWLVQEKQLATKLGGGRLAHVAGSAQHHAPQPSLQYYDLRNQIIFRTVLVLWSAGSSHTSEQEHVV